MLLAQVRSRRMLRSTRTPRSIKNSSRNSLNLQSQPVLPLSLTDDWNLITRPVFQVVNSVPAVTSTGGIYQATGFGDTILATLLSPSPKLAGPWLLGAGP